LLFATGAGALAAGAEAAGGAAEDWGVLFAAGVVAVEVVGVVAVVAAGFGVGVGLGFGARALRIAAIPTLAGGVEAGDGGGSEDAALWPLAPPPRARATTTMITAPSARVTRNGR
jgi:hypothetical protein